MQSFATCRFRRGAVTQRAGVVTACCGRDMPALPRARSRIAARLAGGQLAAQHFRRKQFVDLWPEGGLLTTASDAGFPEMLGCAMRTGEPRHRHQSWASLKKNMRMKTITITGYRRPHLFRNLLKSLLANELANWHIHARIEPTEFAEAYIAIANEMLAGHDFTMTVNPERLGVRRNPFAALQDVFARGSEINIYLEEDMVVSPDVTRLADWFVANHRSTGCACRFWPADAGQPDCSPTRTARTICSCQKHSTPLASWSLVSNGSTISNHFG